MNFEPSDNICEKLKNWFAGGFLQNVSETYFWRKSRTSINPWIISKANETYGGIKEDFSLSFKNFDFKTEGENGTQENLSSPYDSSIGYKLEVDLHYYQFLHNLHSGFPLAPT